jgi:hypothetical protein
MPVLQATDQPYTGVPIVTPETAAPSARGARFEIQATPAAFGGLIAGATQAFGQDLSTASNQLAQAAIQRQELHNSIVSAGATNDYVLGETKLLFGDPSRPDDKGYMGSQGQAAGTASFNTLWQNMQNLRNNLRMGLENDRQRLQFDQETRRQQAFSLGWAGRHFDQEQRVAAIELDKANQTNETLNQWQAAIAGDEAAFNASVTSQITSRFKLLDSQGADPAQYRSNASEIFQGNVITKAEALETIDPPRALHFLESHQGLVFEKNKYDELHGRLQAKGEEAGVAAYLDRKLGLPTSGSAYIPGADSGNTATEVRDILSKRGWPEAPIEGAIANGRAESELQPWGATGGAGEQGIWQFHPGSHLPKYLAYAQAHGAAKEDVAAQTNYMADYVEQHMPGYLDTHDVKTATDRFMTGFEAPYNPVIGSRYKFIHPGTGAPQVAQAQPQPIPSAGAAPGAAPTAPTPSGEPPIYTRGQAMIPRILSGMDLRAQIENDPNISPTFRQKALTQLNTRLEGDLRQYRELDAAAHQTLTDWQTKNAQDLLGKAIARQDIDPNQLSWMVSHQLITDAGYNAVRAELTRQGRGTDDASVYSELNRRADAGEDISNDTFEEINNGRLRGITGARLIAESNAKRQRLNEKAISNNFASLRTLAGMDDQNHPVFNFANPTAKQDQADLWTQAQIEWNHRIYTNRENSDLVLADMAPRYTNTPQSLALWIGRRPKWGAVANTAQVSQAKAWTEDQHSSGAMTDNEYETESNILGQYYKGLHEQEQRAALSKAVQDAAKGITGPKPPPAQPTAQPPTVPPLTPQPALPMGLPPTISIAPGSQF